MGTLTAHGLILAYRDIADDAARALIEAAACALANVKNYLERDFADTIRIEVGDHFTLPTASPHEARIAIPADRIRGDAGGPPEIRGRGPAIVHEIVHIVAPCGHRQWRGLLREGLAVCLQERFGGDSDFSYPNMGRDVHAEAARLIAAHGGPINLADTDRVRRESTGRERRLSYLQQGSFVRFLIETHGVPRFMEIYEGNCFTQVCGVDLPALERAWLKGSIFPVSPLD